MRRDASSERHPFDHEAGWTVLSGFLSEADVDTTLAECSHQLALPARERRAGDKPHAGTHHLAELADRSNVVAEIVQRAELTDVVAEILGPSFQVDEVAYRSPQPSFGGQKLHADDAPKPIDGPASVATAIVALTEFTNDNGSTRLVPGSHRRADMQRRAGSLDHHPDEIRLTGEAGTAFVFNGHVLHSGTTNTSASERPALHFVWRT